MAKDDNTVYYVSNGAGTVMKVTGWVIRSALGGFAKVIGKGWTIVEDSTTRK